METRPITMSSIGHALAKGWQLSNNTCCVSFAYSALFVVFGMIILGFLFARGLTPLTLIAVGAFMLIGPAILAGFFGIAAASEAGLPRHPRNIVRGFTAASGEIWIIALICALLFIAFVANIALLYHHLIGDGPVWLPEFIPPSPAMQDFLLWGTLSGFVIALLMFSVSAFSVPLLCERRAALLPAVAASVRVVISNFPLAMFWAAFMSTVVVGSIVFLPFLPITLPWMAFASRSLYHQTFPASA